MKHKNTPATGTAICQLKIDVNGHLKTTVVGDVQDRAKHSVSEHEYVAGGNRHSVENLWPCPIHNGPDFAPLGMAPVSCWVNSRLKNVDEASMALRESYVMQCRKVVIELSKKINELQMCVYTCAEEGKL